MLLSPEKSQQVRLTVSACVAPLPFMDDVFYFSSNSGQLEVEFLKRLSGCSFDSSER